MRAEMIRRLRFGDLKKVLRHRYGYTLPDDDAGRDDLRELLLPVSFGPEAERKMVNVIQVWAPWMNPDEAGQLLDDLKRTPPHLRKPTSRELGHRLRLTNHERQSLGLRTIAPFDMTPAQLQEQRKAKASEREWRRRRAKGCKPRDAYLANSLNRLRPWEAKGISRATWFRQRRRRRERETKRETGPCAIKLTTNAHGPVSTLRHPESLDRKRPPKKANKHRQGARA